MQSYVEAWESRNVDSMVALLVEDATFAMPPHPHWLRCRDAVVAFIAGAGTPPLRHVVTTANGQPASGRYLPASLEVSRSPATVSEITAFVWPELFGRIGLPLEV